ncbi:MAG: glycosyltransferase [Verrucomicrobia bacterium]|nr:glycosyltransferase [Verrucomicrobiota bacterium]
MISVTHFFTHFQSLGGVQSLLRRHLEMDSRWGLETDVTAFFDTDPRSEPRVSGLGFGWHSTVRSSRRSFSTRLAKDRNRFAVYHNLWGVPFLADLDRAERRIGLLHVYPRVLGNCLSANRGLLDGVLCVSEPLKTLVQQHLPELDPSRVAVVPLPISPCPVVPRRPPVGNRPIVIGFNGRLVKEQKRIDRLPGIVRALNQAGLNYRLEFLGNGPDQTWLERQWRGNPRVIFHGRRTGEDYWKILAGWDLILFTSDFEGLPLSLLEAMSAGVLPIYPRIHSGGDGYARNVHADFLYDLGDEQRVARIVSEIVSAGEPQIESWRACSRREVEPHVGDTYHEVFCGFVRKILEAPRLSREKFKSRPFYLTDFCPFAVLSRIYLRGFYRATCYSNLQSK